MAKMQVRRHQGAVKVRGDHWVHPPLVEKKITHQAEVADGLLTIDSIRASRQTKRLEERVRTMHYAIAYWKMCNPVSFEVPKVPGSIHDCARLGCTCTGLVVELWRAEHSDLRAMHTCVARSPQDSHALCDFTDIYPPKKQPEDLWKAMHRFHVCVKEVRLGKLVSLCEFRDNPLAHKGHARWKCDNIFVCESTGNIHVCARNTCRYQRPNPNNKDLPSCPISGFTGEAKVANKFCTPQGYVSESTIIYESMRRKEVALDKWIEELYTLQTVEEIQNHTNAYRTQTKEKPQIFYSMVAHALIWVLFCDEVVRRKTLDAELAVNNKKRHIIDAIQTQKIKTHRATMSIADQLLKLEEIAHRVYVPKTQPTSETTRFFRGASEAVVKLWYVLKKYTTYQNRKHVCDFPLFVYPALSVLQMGVHVDLEHDRFQVIQQDPAYLRFIPQKSDLLKLHDDPSSFIRYHNEIIERITTAIRRNGIPVEYFIIADVNFDDLQASMFKMHEKLYIGLKR